MSEGGENFSKRCCLMVSPGHDGYRDDGSSPGGRDRPSSMQGMDMASLPPRKRPWQDGPGTGDHEPPDGGQPCLLQTPRRFITTRPGFIFFNPSLCLCRSSSAGRRRRLRSPWTRRAGRLGPRWRARSTARRTASQRSAEGRGAWPVVAGLSAPSHHMNLWAVVLVPGWPGSVRFGPVRPGGCIIL